MGEDGRDLIRVLDTRFATASVSDSSSPSEDEAEPDSESSRPVKYE